MTSSFHGSWKIDVGQSKIWDYESARFVPDEIGEELISIRIDDGSQDYEVLLGDRPTIRMGYTSRYDHPEWVPYTVRQIHGIRETGSDRELTEFVKRTRQRASTFRVGAIYGLVRTAYVDERTHYRFSKDTNGVAEYVMQRRLAEDGQSFVSTVLRVDGSVSIVRRFVRVGDSPSARPTDSAGQHA
jgi:hypothetical protein